MVLMMLPVLIVALVITIFACSRIYAMVNNQLAQELKIAATTMRNQYQADQTVDYVMNNEQFMKGQIDLSDNEHLDKLKEELDIDMTIFYGDTRIATSLYNEDGTRMVGTKAADTVIDTVLKNGEDYFVKDIQIGGIDYYGYYTPLTQPSTGEIVGMLFTGSPSRDLLKSINSVIIGIIIITAVISIVIFSIGTYLCNLIGNVIRKISDMMHQFSEGDTSIQVPKKLLGYKDELGVLSRDMQKMLDEIGSIVSSVRELTEKLQSHGSALDDIAQVSSKASEEVAHAIEEISKSAVAQASETQNASANVSNIKEEVDGMVNTVGIVSDASNNMQEVSLKTMDIITDLKNKNTNTTDIINNVGKEVADTNTSVQDIREATEIITSIADQTSLLSLNASIEAACAGEAGRGFAVVASEIQSLATQSNESAERISKTIQTLLDQSEKTVTRMQTLNTDASAQNESLEETISYYENLNTAIKSTAESVATFKSGTEELSKAQLSLEEIVDGLSAISEENAAATEQITASMQELTANINEIAASSNDIKMIADTLKEKMNHFH